MLFFIRSVSAIVFALLASVCLEWTTPGYIKLGGLAAGVCTVLITAMMWTSRTKPVKGLRIPPSKLREVFVGSMFAALWVGLVQVYFFLALNTASIVDRDRGEIERSASLLEDAGNYEAASDILLNALGDPHTPEFIGSLAERVILDLTRAADSAVGGDREVLLKKAIALAVRFKLPADLPKLALNRLTDADSLADFQDQLDVAKTRAAKAESEQDRLLREQKEAEAKAAEAERQSHVQTEELKRRADSLNSSLRRLVALAQKHGASLSGNAIDGDLVAAKTTLLSLIKETGGQDPAASAAVKELESAIYASLPTDLPEGVSARIRRIDTSLMSGLSLVDVELVDSAGQPLLGLIGKDFAASQGGHKLRLTAAPMSKAGMLVAAILIDTSVSTSGAPINATKIAVPQFVGRLPDNATVRLSSFSDRLKLLADWTSDKARVSAVAQSIKADGGTALRQAAYQEVQALATKLGVKVLIVFSDGADSLPGPAPDEIITAAKQAKVAIHFVALKGAGYSDTSVIERIAHETGGKTFLVEEASKLSHSFQLLADSLQETGYRLALLNHDCSSPCKLVIGGKGSVTLDLATAQTSPPVVLTSAKK